MSQPTCYFMHKQRSAAEIVLPNSLSIGNTGLTIETAVLIIDETIRSHSLTAGVCEIFHKLAAITNDTTYPGANDAVRPESS